MAKFEQGGRRRPSSSEYLAVSAIIVAGVLAIAALSTRPAIPADPTDIVSPMIAMFALTAAVWLLMVISRNGAVLLGGASLQYFRDYETEPPSEWIERPARAFNNLMQVPTLFYVVMLMMIALHSVDALQLSLAWMYVASRAIHAAIYILFNHVPFRFAVYAVSCITLAIMWARFALNL
jgi:hypothetical protein